MSSADHPTAGPPTPSQTPSPIASTAKSPILSIGRAEADPRQRFETHHHPEPMLLWASTATLTVAAAARDWLVPPGYGLWIPGEVEHAAATLHAGEISLVTFAPVHCPITWTEPTGLLIGPLLRELITHLHRIEPGDSSRSPAEALMFQLLTPLPTHAIRVSMPTDPRVRIIAEALIADPGDLRELAAWADHVHAGVRTLSRVFSAETGLSFARWRYQVRLRAAVQLLAGGASVSSTARAVGYRKTSAFIAAFRRGTGQTPGTYLPVETTFLPGPLLTLPSRASPGSRAGDHGQAGKSGDKGEAGQRGEGTGEATQGR